MSVATEARRAGGAKPHGAEKKNTNQNEKENCTCRVNQIIRAWSDCPSGPRCKNGKRGETTNARDATVSCTYWWPMVRRRETVERNPGVVQNYLDDGSRGEQSLHANVCADQQCGGTPCSKFRGIKPVHRKNKKRKGSRIISIKQSMSTKGKSSL